MDYIRLKETIFFKVFNLENENRRGISDVVAKSNISKYYVMFEELYKNNRWLFVKSLIELSDINDEIYNRLKSETKETPYFSFERIIVNILRIRICFDIETENIKKPLKNLICGTINENKQSNFKEAHANFILFHDILQFISESIEMAIDESSQLFFENKTKIKSIFTDFISINDVKNVETALIYKELYKHKLISFCPVYIRQAIKLNRIFDENLVTIDIWEKYFCKQSFDKINKDIFLFKKMGFLHIPDAMENINVTIASKQYSSKAQKEQVCRDIIKRFNSNIKQAIATEPVKYTIDSFLEKQIKTANG